MNRDQYDSLVAIAREIYDTILLCPTPKRFIQRELDKHSHLCAITNRWLVFQNIKEAAINRNFSSVQIGYNKSEALLAATTIMSQIFEISILKPADIIVR